MNPFDEDESKLVPGEDICMRCSSDLPEENFGYCSSCLEAQEKESDELLELQTPNYEWIKKYSEKRKKEVHEFIKREEVELITIHQAIELFEQDHRTDKIRAVLSPELAASVSYELVKPVVYIQSADNFDIEWLRKYWLQKYEIELQPFEMVVGLVFTTWGEYGPYSNTYDFPSCLFSTFAVLGGSNNE